MNKQIVDYVKATKVISSCVNDIQLNAARKYCGLFYTKWGWSGIDHSLELQNSLLQKRGDLIG